MQTKQPPFKSRFTNVATAKLIETVKDEYFYYTDKQLNDPSTNSKTDFL